MDVVALAATIGGSVVAITGVVVTARGARQQRETAKELAEQQRASTQELAELQHEHEWRVARESRLHNELRDTYQAVLDLVGAMATRVERTHPILGPVPPPLPMPMDEDMLRLTAQLARVGSDDVIAALDVVARTYQTFLFDASTLDRVIERPTSGERDARQNVDAARQQFRDAQAGLGRAIRAETRA